MDFKFVPVVLFLFLQFCYGRTPLHPRYVRNFYNSPNAPAASGPYSHAVVARGKWVFISGQGGYDAVTDTIVSGGIVKETEKALENVLTILKEVGGDKKHIMKMTNYLKDMHDLDEVNQAYVNVFKGKYPARATFQVAALPAEGNIEIDAVAVIDNGF
uniref:Uncharacterized protein n=1 Tax=Strigamia maritima TaxID=126957 RepID=T1IX60_STRMM